jgi:hypothetical protein
MPQNQSRPHRRSRRTKQTPDEAESTREVVVAADSPVRALAGVPPSAEVIFQGAPILALNPATNNLTASAGFLQHELVRDRYFFTLPPALWDETHRQIGADAFAADLAELETELGAICRDHSTKAGLWRGQAFPYHHLHRMAIPSVSAANMGWDMNQADLDRQLRIAEQRIDGIARTARGYLGWLLLNPSFLNEHDAVLQAHQGVIARWGTAALGLPIRLPGFDQANADEQSVFLRADAQIVAFLCRWRLQGLAAPYLPVPLQPQLAGEVPTSVLNRYLQTGGLFVVPDTFPVPSRDEFRGMLDDALHGSPPDHLAEWMAFVARDNTAKQTITRFARLFQLQHYWRVLHNRHPLALRRKSTVLKQVLASFLKTSEKSIHLDLIEIRSRLGNKWLDRGAGFSFGPF